MVSERPRGAESQDRAHQANLEAFVLRARRVEAHSLAVDKAALMSLAGAQMHITIKGDGSVEWRQDLPPEEQVESAAARVRPLLLQQEACYYNKALKALNHFDRSPQNTDWIRQVRRVWQARVVETATREAGYQSMVTDTVTGESAELDDLKLALAWIYGDVVHHDTVRRQEAGLLGLQERFRAAVPLVAFIMLHTIGLLHRIQALQSAGELNLASAVFEEPVTLTSTTMLMEGTMRIAPVGSPAPVTAIEPLGPEWKILTPPPVGLED
ncbi:hypothetical protein F5983_35925 [Streptomyces arboris]|uniref:Uncharacterized protein n=2 Tax=Streptomyces arboris TaxID=2600619 RepID=A0A5N5EBG7_9ACTN|nr:hypothetical protein F5983_35925 [Streptomyces arboris]